MFLLKSFSPISFSPTSFVFDGVVPPSDQPIQGGGIINFASQYKYRYNVEEEAVPVLEQAAKQQIEQKQLVTLEKTFRDMGVAYKDAYKDAYKEVFAIILAQLRAEIQEQEDEQIAIIIASML